MVCAADHDQFKISLIILQKVYRQKETISCQLWMVPQGNLKPDLVGHVSGPKFCAQFDLADIQSNLQSNNFIQDLQRSRCNFQFDDCKNEELVAIPTNSGEIGDASNDVINKDDLTKMNDPKRRHGVNLSKNIFHL